MFTRQERIKRREAGKCDSPCLQYFRIAPIAIRNNKTPRQLTKAGK
jgi:hypothetical protein